MTPSDDVALVIGIDARAASEVGAGRGRVMRELLRALGQRGDPHRYLCYARRAWAGASLDERFCWRLIPASDPWWHLRTARAASRECDVFLSSNSYLTLALLRIPAVPIVYDLVAFDPAMKPRLRSVLIERLTLGLAVRRATALLAISQATADALLDRYPTAAGRVTVAHLGVGPGLSPGAPPEGVPAARAQPHPLPAPADLDALPDRGFVLAVGTLEPRKNLPALVRAYTSLDEAVQGAHPLVVAGDLGWSTGETLASLRSLGERAQVLGRVSDAALAELYRRCAVFCYPSLAEGFGLPVLEAMAAGAPVVTSDRSSLPEVGGEAVEYADPTSVTSIAAALDRVLRSPERRAALSAAGRQRAEQFTWERTAGIVVETLAAAAAAAAGG